MEISTLGIDLSKTTFHVIGLNARGEIVLRKKFSRKQLLVFTANPAADPDWNGSLRRRALPRSCPAGTRPRRQAHAGTVREALRQDE